VGPRGRHRQQEPGHRCRRRVPCLEVPATVAVRSTSSELARPRTAGGRPWSGHDWLLVRRLPFAGRPRHHPRPFHVHPRKEPRRPRCIGEKLFTPRWSGLHLPVERRRTTSAVEGESMKGRVCSRRQAALSPWPPSSPFRRLLPACLQECPDGAGRGGAASFTR
jgi:hypothetical protein